MSKKLFVVFVAISFVSLPLLPQNNSVLRTRKPQQRHYADTDSLAVVSRTDSVAFRNGPILADTINWVDDTGESAKSAEMLIKTIQPFKPNPTKAVIYSAIFPGLGQIYNRKYWKLPIVYGGFLGFVYAITWNGRLYGDYTQGYRAIMSENYLDPGNVAKYIYIFKTGTDPSQWSANELSNYREAIRRKRDFFRRNRDLSIIGSVAMYALCMIDAYVDAQLYDFDISPDLSIKVGPMITTDAFSQKSFGLQCSIKF
jgi:hypothetical protein